MFGERLKFLRKKASMTQSELAKLLNVVPSTIGMYESGKSDPDSSTIVSLADFFNVTTDYLLGVSPKPNFFVESDIDDIIFIIDNLSKESKDDLRYFLKLLVVQDKYNNISNK